MTTDNENNTCPTCKSQALVECRGTEVLNYKDQAVDVPFVYLECSECGNETTSQEQDKENIRSFAIAKKHIDGFLTGDEIKAIRERLNLTQVEASKVFGGASSTFSKYEHDAVCPSYAMDILLRATGEVPELAEWLLRKNNLDHKIAAVQMRQAFNQQVTFCQVYGTKNHRSVNITLVDADSVRSGRFAALEAAEEVESDDINHNLGIYRLDSSDANNPGVA